MDSYVVYYERGYVTYHGAQELRVAKKRLSRFSSRVSFVNLPSDEAVLVVPNELDFVYVDGNHRGDQVWRDLCNYWPKVRKGGVLGGHDFKLPNFERLVSAVVQFAALHKLVLHGERLDY